MRLYILRHGKSPQLAESGVSRDEDRPLAPVGRQAVRRMAAYLKEQGGRPALILTSPLLRARDSAREVAAVLGMKAVEEFRPLDGGCPAKALWEKLSERLEHAPEALVAGHQPQLGELVAYLTGTLPKLKPGGLVAVEFTPERCRLLWAKNPEDLD